MNKLLISGSTRLSVAAAMVYSGMLCAGSHAAEVSGVSLPEAAKVAEQPLVLNGAGLRAMAVFKVYVIGMYLPQRSSSVPTVLDMPGPKRLQMVLMRDVEGEDLGRALGRGIADNNSAQEMLALQSRVDQLKQAMTNRGETPKGSQVLLDYAPATGTHITINGKALLTDIPGEDFYKALLRVWLGPRPAGDYLKQELLGHSG